MNSQTPPIEWDDLPPPPDLDFSMPDDPFPDELFAGNSYDYLPDDDPFEPFTSARSGGRRRTDGGGSDLCQ